MQPTSYGGPLVISPGSIKRISKARLRRAWDSRGTDREGALDVFRHAVYSFRKGDMTDILGITEEELEAFLAPQMTDDEKALLLDANEISDDAVRRARVDSVIGAMRSKGWSLPEIGEVLGIGRQATLARNPGGKEAATEELLARISEPQRIRSVSLGTIPAYAFDETLAQPDISVVPSERREHLAALARKRAALPPRGEASPAENAVRDDLGKQIAEVAVAIRDEYGISLSRLAIHSGFPRNRHVFARLAKRNGFDAHLPPSLV